MKEREPLKDKILKMCSDWTRPQQVWEKLMNTDNSRYSYTYVMQTMSRMAQMGLLKIKRGEGLGRPTFYRNMTKA